MYCVYVLDNNISFIIVILLYLFSLRYNFCHSTWGIQNVLNLAIFRYIFGQKNVTGLCYKVLLVFSKNFMSSACLFYEMQFIEFSW
jgi:hypothetical protein